MKRIAAAVSCLLMVTPLLSACSHNGGAACAPEASHPSAASATPAASSAPVDQAKPAAQPASASVTRVGLFEAGDPREERDDSIRQQHRRLGICGYRTFASTKATPIMGDLIHMTDCAVDLVGIGHVSIGMDHKRLMQEVWG